MTTDNQKVRLATHMLEEEAKFWWMNSKGRMEAGVVVVSWEKFKEEFLKKYFPADIKSKKEVEFLHLKHGSMSVAKYAAKFEELSRFCPYINAKDAEESKCIKCERGLCLKIYQYVGFHEIRDFDTLVNNCRIFDEAGKTKASFYKMVNDRKGKGHDCGKPYCKDNGTKKDFSGGSKPSGGDLKYFRCGGSGHYANDCKNPTVNCYKCGKTGHHAYECKSKEIVCYKC